jgi:hypothetical protein
MAIRLAYLLPEAEMNMADPDLGSSPIMEVFRISVSDEPDHIDLLQTIEPILYVLPINYCDAIIVSIGNVGMIETFITLNLPIVGITYAMRINGSMMNFHHDFKDRPLSTYRAGTFGISSRSTIFGLRRIGGGRIFETRNIDGNDICQFIG